MEKRPDLKQLFVVHTNNCLRFCLLCGWRKRICEPCTAIALTKGEEAQIELAMAMFFCQNYLV